MLRLASIFFSSQPAYFLNGGKAGQENSNTNLCISFPPTCKNIEYSPDKVSSHDSDVILI